MSFDCLNVPTIPNPVGLDVVFNSIQEDLSQISWIEYSFGHAYPMKEVRDGEVYNIPKAYGSSEEFVRLDPNDKVSGFSFILKDDDETLNYFDIPKFNTTNEINLGVVVFANLDYIDNTRDYIFTENLKQDVKNILVRNEFVTNLVSFTEGLDNTWSGFSRPDVKFYTEKYTTFKYIVQVNYDEFCYEVNTYNNTRCLK